MIVLIHSPLVGTFAWSRVAAEFARRGIPVIAPALTDEPAWHAPYWQQHAASVASALADVSVETKLVLVGHSGAGPLLPAIRAELPHRIGSYIFVDAGVPRANATRLDLMRGEDRAWAEEFETYLKGGGTFPNWTDASLSEIIPDPDTRAALRADLRPRARDFFTEPLPVFDGFPDAPCGFLQLSPAYDRPASFARTHGFAYRDLGGGHFAMLTRPAAVADALIDLRRQMENDAKSLSKTF